MSKLPKLLIGSGNKGKITEIRNVLETLPFELVSLADLDREIPDLDETAETIEENALQKARYYAKETNMVTLADDSGLFLDAKPQWPGVRTKRVADTNDARREIVIAAATQTGNNAASFQSAVALYNPVTDESHIALGKTTGEIRSNQAGEHLPQLPYDTIFYLPEHGKTYAELTTEEKNALSHRGKALIKMKYMLHNLFRPKHVVVPVALIVKEGKLLMNRRNDPHNPAVHNTWEFPGGSVEYKESLEENVLREAKEEVGYDLEIVSMLSHIAVDPQEKPGGVFYQVYLIPYVCRIVGGDGSVRDAEVLESKWFTLDDVLKQHLIAKNGDMYKALLPELKQIIADYKLDIC